MLSLLGSSLFRRRSQRQTYFHPPILMRSPYCISARATINPLPPARSRTYSRACAHRQEHTATPISCIRFAFAKASLPLPIKSSVEDWIDWDKKCRTRNRERCLFLRVIRRALWRLQGCRGLRGCDENHQQSTWHKQAPSTSKWPVPIKEEPKCLVWG